MLYFYGPVSTGSVHMPKLIQELKKNQKTFHPVVSFNPAAEKIMSLDLTKNNTGLTEEIYGNTQKFSAYIDQKRKDNGAKFLIGGYNELREMYKRSPLFDLQKKYAIEENKTQEARRLHLGIDIWGEEGTVVYAPLGGLVHSFAFNNNYGDYGATLILLHQLDSVTFYTLYGHLSLGDISKFSEFQYIIRGYVIGHFGKPEENGNWPPHLHFQIIRDIRMNKGDYPGVCTLEEAKKYLANCPDPDLILNLRPGN